MKLSKMHQRVANRSNRNVTGDFTGVEARIEGHYGEWGWEGPNKADKGRRLGSCNVTRCQRAGAYWYNSGTRAWYCTNCAHGINYAPLPDGSYLCKRDEDAFDEYLKGLA